MTEYSDYDACPVCGKKHCGALCDQEEVTVFQCTVCHEHCKAINTSQFEDCGQIGGYSKAIDNGKIARITAIVTKSEVFVECHKCLGDHHSSKCNFSLPDREIDEMKECTECGRLCVGALPPCRHLGTACKRCDTAISNDVGYCNKCLAIMTSGCCGSCGHEINSSDISCDHCGARGEG